MLDRLFRFVLYVAMLPVVGAIFPANQNVAAAQAGETVISVAVPQFIADFFNEELFAQFEAEHPGVKVHVKTINEFGLPVAEFSTAEEYLESMAEWASYADVVLVDNNLLPEATRAGYLLDLSPLVNSDSSLNVDDFYTGLWESFRWDGGIWALPVAGDAVMLFYVPSAFDEAGLTYPDASWTMADFENAIRQLTSFNPDGTVEKLALQNLESTPELLVSLIGAGVVDDTVTPSVPDFSNPLLEELLTAWAGLDEDGLLTMPDGMMMVVSGEDTSPMVIGRSAFGSFSPNLVPAPLPGGKYAITANGFGVSGGTRYPEAAYELVKYLTNSPEVATRFFGNVPARRSLQGVQVENDDNGPVFIGGGERSPELIAAMEDALENGISPSDARFANFLTTALNKVMQDGLDPRTALQETEADVLERLAIADERKGTETIEVATPPAPVQVAEGEISIKLGVSSNIMPFPNEDKWKAIVDEFAANDPEVGLVEFEVATARGGNSDMAENYDCFYMPNNIVQDTDLSQLRSLDPLLTSDPNYDPDDMVGSVMTLMQRDGQTWGFPAMIQPQAMRYNPTLFEQAGVSLPQGQWTISEFESALRSLKTTFNETPFIPRGFGSSHLLMLIAAYGGVFDPETGDPDLTNPATVEAIRQVLNLAKEGLMDYQALAQGNAVGGMRIVMVTEDGSNPTALYTELLNGFAFGPARIETEENGPVINPAKLVTFPVGSQFAAVSYDVSAFYISAQTQHAEACYRLIDQLTRDTELFAAMPVRRSQIDDLATTQGQEAVDFYTALDELMRKPETVVLPTPFGGGTPAAFVAQYWMNRAFDRYVLEDADLDTELAQAAQYTADYEQCAAAIPEFNPANASDFQAYMQQFDDCAKQADPTYGA